MNIWDILILILVLSAVACAIVHIVRVRRRGGVLCGGDCARCTASCAGGSKAMGSDGVGHGRSPDETNITFDADQF